MAYTVGKIKVAYIQHNPTPYRIPMEAMLSRRDDLDFNVFYCHDTEFDKPWKINWDKHTFRVLPGWHPRFGEEFWLHWNPRIFSVLQDGKFDIIVTGGYIQPTMLAALLWARRHHVPYVVISESNAIRPRNLLKRVVKRILLHPLLSNASAGLAVGTYAKAYLHHYGIPEDRIFILPNTPDIDFFTSESTQSRRQKSEVKRELGLEEESLICFVGKFVRRKRVDLLLSAFRRLKTDADGADVGLVLAGDGPERGRLQAMVREQAIPNVHFVGFQQPHDLPRVYAVSDLFVLPSVYETWGVVVNEAMACGLPVVVTNQVGAAGDIVKDGKNGYIVPVDDVDALYNAIKRIILAPVLKERMGQASLELIASWDYKMGVEDFVRAVHVAVNTAEGS